jgi:HEAT repeat protein
MTVVLEHIIDGMLAVLGALIIADAAIRIRIDRDARRDRRLRPGAELAVGEFLAGSRPDIQAVARDERDVLLQVAMEALGDLTGSERDRLASLLDRLGYVTQAGAGLTARRRAARRQAAEVLATIATPGTIPALTAGISDGDPIVRCTCARTLAEIGGHQIQADVAEVARRDAAAAPGLAAAVVLALGEHRPAALAPLLARGSDRQIRAIAVTVASELRLAELAPLLRDCLEESDDLAERAAQGLGRIGDVTATGALLRLAADQVRGSAARAAAVTAVGSIGDPAAVPVVETLLRSDGWSLRNAAAMALPRLGAAGLAALRQAAASPVDEIREQAEAVLRS